MDMRGERLKELIEWLELRGFEANEKDIEIFESIIGLAMNDGYKEATQVIKKH